MTLRPFPSSRVAPLLLTWVLLGLGLGVAVSPARGATSVTPELRGGSDQEKARLTQERAWRLQKEQAAAALRADRHQKAFRHAVMARVNARAQQRAAEISRQLAPAEALSQRVSGSRKPLVIGTAVLLAGFLLLRWQRGSPPG